MRPGEGQGKSVWLKSAETKVTYTFSSVVYNWNNDEIDAMIIKYTIGGILGAIAGGAIGYAGSCSGNT